MGLVLRAGDETLEETVRAPRDGVGVAECWEEGLFPAYQNFPGAAVGRGGRISGRGGNEHGKLARPGLVAIIGEGCVVGGDDFGREVANAAAFDDAASMEIGNLLRVALPGQKCLTH